MGPECSDPAYYWTHLGECLAEAGGAIVSQATSDGLDQVANAMLDAVGSIIAAIGTMWVHLRTPDIRNLGGEGVDLLGQAPPASQEFIMILNWIMGICVVLAVGSLIVAAMSMMARRREGDSTLGSGRVLLIAGTTAVAMSAGAIIAAVLPRGAAADVNGAVEWLQNSLFWWTAVLAVMGLLIACGHIIWTQRTEGYSRVLGGLLRLIIVSVSAATAIAILTNAADAFASWLLLNSTSGCDVNSTSDSCFAENIGAMLVLTGSNAIGAIAIIGLGFIIWLAGVVQMFLLVIRTGVLVVIAGIMPLAAAASMTRQGEEMFKKIVAWTLAFILYKPAAAIIYAVAFNLTGSNVWGEDSTGLISIITGITLMALSLLALPALMRLIVPAVSAVAGGAGMAGMAAVGGMAAAGGLELATGAVSNGSRSGSRPAMSSPAGGGTGAAPTAGPTGAAPTAAAPAAAGGGAGAAASTAGSGAAAGGGAAAAGGGAAAAGAGPAGIALVATKKVAETAQKVGEAAKSTAQDAAGSAEPEQR